MNGKYQLNNLPLTSTPVDRFFSSSLSDAGISKSKVD